MHPLALRQVRDYAAFGSEPVACIGVAPWGCVANRHVLVNHADQACHYCTTHCTP